MTGKNIVHQSTRIVLPSLRIHFATSGTGMHAWQKRREDQKNPPGKKARKPSHAFPPFSFAEACGLLLILPSRGNMLDETCKWKRKKRKRRYQALFVPLCRQLHCRSSRNPHRFRIFRPSIHTPSHSDSSQEESSREKTDRGKDISEGKIIAAVPGAAKSLPRARHTPTRQREKSKKRAKDFPPSHLELLLVPASPRRAS